MAATEGEYYPAYFVSLYRRRWFARGYDGLLSLLLLGREEALRRTVAQAALRGHASLRVLDLACGTGKQIQALLREARRTGTLVEVVGVDLSGPMLRQARHKGRGETGRLCRAPMECLPFADATFGAATTVWGLHEVPSPYRLRIAREVHRVLRRGGRWVILDYGRPRRRWEERRLRQWLRWTERYALSWIEEGVEPWRAMGWRLVEVLPHWGGILCQWVLEAGP
jgi:ubiquinone/menaquinone biosynthesis C-methylase UbiE